MKWTTQDGRKMEVSDMETGHIQKALAMLRRKGFVSPSDVIFMLTCRPPNGDMASLAFDQEMDLVFNAPVSNFIDEFETELKERI